ncbi:MAG: ATP-binding protein [Chloroflexi bacterium]|nr:ATP-binding protein [Chloroflexota bacterium]
MQVLEVVTPRTNTATLSSAENFFASIALSEPFEVELAADSTRRRFLVRAGSQRMRDQLVSQIGAAYPQADLRSVQPEDDPARPRPGEQFAACTLQLRAPAYLPIRMFTDLDVDGERSAQADPILGIVSVLGDLPAGWRGLSQLVVQRAPEDWCRGYQRLSIQHPLEHERLARPGEGAAPAFAFATCLLVMLAVAFQAVRLYRAEAWLQLAVTLLAALAVVVGTVWVVRRLRRPTVYDMDLVREKVTRTACRTELRLVVFAPTEVSAAQVRLQLERFATVYRRFNLAAANGFVPHRARPDPAVLIRPEVWHARRQAVLTTLELAGLWHLPHAAADVALLERTSARRWLPLPTAVAEGCPIGTATHQSHQVSVALPPDVLRRHLLLVAKTRRGKSTLLQRLARYAMQCAPRRAVLVVDPHRDLAEAVLGLVPPERRDAVVHLDVADRAQPFGLNLLDTGLGWDRDRAVANALTIFQREWGDRFWGPRMEDAFRYALMSLYEANLRMCRSEPGSGRSQQYTLLEVPQLLTDTLFRREVLNSVDDPSIRGWWEHYFEPMDRRFQTEVVNPVLTKIHRFDGNTSARQIVGQSESTIDPAVWLRDRAIIIVNTARGMIGENSAALIGSTLLNLVSLAVAEQVGVRAEARCPISIFVDEFHTMPGADYEGILAELSKYGANLVLATQSLARLLALGRDEGRGLRATVFANLDGLFAFNCSAEDAEYLVPELGGVLDEQDLVELGEHQCYVRLSAGGKRMPTFSVHLDPPLTPEPGLRDELAQRSRQRFGRAATVVEAERRAMRERILELRTRHLSATAQPPAAATAQMTPGATRQPMAAAGAQSTAAAPGPLDGAKSPARNQHRTRKKKRANQERTKQKVADAV